MILEKGQGLSAEGARVEAVGAEGSELGKGVLPPAGVYGGGGVPPHKIFHLSMKINSMS